MNIIQTLKQLDIINYQRSMGLVVLKIIKYNPMNFSKSEQI